MDIDELFSYLDSSTIDWKPVQSELAIQQAILVESSALLSALQPQTACFAPASLFNHVPESMLAECAFVVWADEAPKPVSSRVAAAHCKDRSAWLQAFSTVTDQLATLREKEAALLDMAQLISQNVSLKRLCVEAAKILERPTSILDNSLSFLAHSNDFPEYAAGRSEEQTGMIPDAGIKAMKDQGLTPPMTRCMPPTEQRPSTTSTTARPSPTTSRSSATAPRPSVRSAASPNMALCAPAGLPC